MSSQPAGRVHPPSVARVLAKLRRLVPSDARDPERSDAVTAAVRVTVDDERARLADGSVPRTVDDLARDAELLLASFEDPAGALPGAVINATGVVLHTNLGRAPWPAAAMVAAAAAAQGYELLELDVRTGRRGPRFRRAEDHLVALTGADDALVVNNNAAAVAIAVGLAGPGGGVVVSRGELVEIGGGVRIPEMIERAGARLVEVGTTNRTRASDFERPLVDGIARVVLRVHPSNFTMAGFIEEPDARQVADLAHAKGAIVIDDLGSGALLATERFGLLHEPTPRERLDAGADVVTFSGDKLVGGPQVGLIVGRADLVGRMRRDPLARAMRPDKAILAAVAATLGLYRAGVAARSVPIWMSIATAPATLRARADRLAAGVSAAGGAATVEVIELRTAIGGGSLPGQTVRSWGVRVTAGPAAIVAAALRRGEPPILARIMDDDVVLDLRTVDAEQDAVILRRIGELATAPGMTLVVGTAGHIDHGKTTLLRALTGIDADRLPEERRRGMTIDVGYAHLELDDGTTIDLVDVPGHDKLVGNMLVGAGEIDAALLVVAADDGPRAQTLEHLALLDALGIGVGVAVVTKTDAVEADRVVEVVADVQRLLGSTSLAGAPVLAASGTTGEGLDEVRAALVALRDRVVPIERPPTLAIDRVFTVKGRGVVVTGTLRGGPLAAGDTMRVVPDDESATDGTVRVREIQVHGTKLERVAAGGRTALNLAGVTADRLHRGVVLTADVDVTATDRVLVVFQAPIADRTRGRVHAGTAAVDAAVGRAGRDALTLPDGRPAGILRLTQSIAARQGDRLVLRRGTSATPVGGVVLDPSPPRGLSRRRQTPERVAALATGGPAARLDLHGVVASGRRVTMAPDIAGAAAEAALAAVPTESTGVPVTSIRAAAAAAIRRLASVRRDAALVAAGDVVDALVADGRLIRDGDLIRRAGVAAPAPDPTVAAAMDRLEAALAVAAPPSLAAAARLAGCPADGVRALERAGRIVVLEPDLAYAMATYRDLAAVAMRLAARTPLTPAAFRDATGTSRKYVMAILEDLDRRAILHRTAAGHVPGPRAPSMLAAPDPGR